MSLVFESISSQGDMQQQAIGPEGLQVSAVAGMTYRIVDTTDPDGAIAARVRKVGDNMVIDLPDSGQTVVIQDYYFVCRFDYRSCVLQLDSHGAQAGSVVSAEQLPIERLSDGSLLIWASGGTIATGPAQTPADGGYAVVTNPVIQNEPVSDRAPEPNEGAGGIGGKWAVVGGLGLGIVALAGGGSDGPAVGSDSAGNGDDGSNVDGGATDPGNDGEPDGGTNAGGDPNTGGDNGAGGDTNTGGDANGGGDTDTNGGSSGDGVDTTAPVSPVLAIVAGDDIVSIGEQQSVVVISGTAEPGSTVQVSLGTLVQSTSTDADGRFVFSIAPGNLPVPGSYLLSAVATDQAGNTSAVASRSVVIEATPGSTDGDPEPEVSIDRVIDDVARFTGVLADGDVTNDNVLLVSGTLDGTLVAGQRVELLNAGELLGVAETRGSTWQFETDALRNGQVSLEVRVVDAAGDVMATGDDSFDLTLDTDAPRRPQFQPVEQNSVVDEDEAVDGVQLEGTGEAGATVEATWLDTQISGLIDDDGDWTLTFDTLPDGVSYGANSISVVQVDQAGNESTARVRNIWLELPDLLGNDDSLFAILTQGVFQSFESGVFTGENGGGSLLDDLTAGLSSTASF